MPRSLRILSATNTSTNDTKTNVAEPPESINVESDLVVILAALLCALICVVGLVAVTRCAWLRRRSTTGTGSARAPPQANKGIKKKKLELLPKFTYSTAKEGFKKFNSVECAICLAEFAEGDEFRVLPQCGHGFHVGCIDMWLGSHSSCPSCRQILVVTRCQKCGQFPATPSSSSSSSSSGGAGSPELELKSREGCTTISVDTNQAQNPNYLP